jgi:hypothetical protein
MAIVVNSDQWTGETDNTPLAAPIVWGEFADRAALDRAVERIEAEGSFRRGDEVGPGARPGPADNAQQVAPPDEDPLGADARNRRQLGVGLATAATSMAAAGIVIATGGAALPAVAAAAAAGGATAAAGEAVGVATDPASSGNPADASRPVMSGPAVGLRADTAERRSKAEELLRACGAGRVWAQETRAG